MFMWGGGGGGGLFGGHWGEVFVEAEERMGLVVELGRRNVEEGTGGPFGAGVFEMASGRLVAVGVNMVVHLNCSLAHAEMAAMALAQQKLSTYDLGGDGMPECELVTSTEPCAMCLGAIPWSGVRSLVCGARGTDAMEVGFDEGSKPADWVGTLERRGIKVVRQEARAVLLQYKSMGGTIYNARGGGSREEGN